MEIGNKKYPTDRLIQDAGSYESFNWGEEPEDNRLVERTWDHKALNDLSKEISASNPLIHNLPRLGWFHFRLENLPGWPLMEHPTGEYEWSMPRSMATAAKSVLHKPSRRRCSL